MGLFTVITDEEGKRFQIKTGYDKMDRYEHKIGEELPWHVDKDRAGQGHLLDGIYLAEPEEDGHRVTGLYWWVVIRDHKVEDVRLAMNWNIMNRDYPIPPHPREWWTEEAWERHSEEKKQAVRERLAFQALYGHRPPMEQIGILAGKFMKAKMECESLSRRILPKDFRGQAEKEPGPDSLSIRMAEKIQNMPEMDDLEWYCDSCDWVGDYNEVLYPNQPIFGGHPACPNCPSDDSIHSRKKGTMCPECRGKGTVPDHAHDHKFFDPDQAQVEARMGGTQKECPNCKGRGAV